MILLHVSAGRSPPGGIRWSSGHSVEMGVTETWSLSSRYLCCVLAAGAGTRDRSINLSLGDSLEVVPLLCYSASVLLGQRNGVSHFWGQFLFSVLIFLASGFPMMEVCVISSVSQPGRDLEEIQVSHSHWYFVIITVIFTYKIKALATGCWNASRLWKYLSSEVRKLELGPRTCSSGS